MVVATLRDIFRLYWKEMKTRPSITYLIMQMLNTLCLHLNNYHGDNPYQISLMN